MELNLSNTVQIITVIGFGSCIIKLIVINPLQSAIGTLQKAVEEMKGMLNNLSCEQKSMGERIVACESSTKSAHHRIDGLEGRV